MQPFVMLCLGVANEYMYYKIVQVVSVFIGVPAWS